MQLMSSTIPGNENYNIKVLALSTDDARSKKRVRPMVSGKNWSFEVYSDTNQEFKRSLNVSGISSHNCSLWF